MVFEQPGSVGKISIELVFDKKALEFAEVGSLQRDHDDQILEPTEACELAEKLDVTVAGGSGHCILAVVESDDAGFPNDVFARETRDDVVIVVEGARTHIELALNPLD